MSKTLYYEEIYRLTDRQMPLRIYKNPRAKSLTLRIETGGKSLRVSMPSHIALQDALDFVNRHQIWIANKLAKLPAPQNGPMLKPNSFIPIFGKPHKIIHNQGRGVTKIIQDEQGNDLLVVYGNALHLSRHVAAFLKKQAALVIAPLVFKHADSINKKPISIRYKDTKSRWGSCSSKGNLSFSWRIAMAPKAVIDYLVAHEVAHLKEMNHGPNFWALCERLCPNFKTYQAWLKRNGQALHAIDFTL